MSDLTERITAVLREHRFDGELFECWCQRDLPDAEVMCMDREEHAAHVAERVAELFTEERAVQFEHSDQICVLDADQKYSDYGPNWRNLRHFVSSWSVVEQQP